METLSQLVKKWGKAGAIGLFLLFAFFAGNFSSTAKNNSQEKVLGVHAYNTPTPSPLPTPTAVPVTIINNIIVPTQALVSVTPAPTSSPIVIIVTPTPTPTPTPSPTPTPTPVAATVTVDVDYAGEHPESPYTTTITNGESAWQAVQDGVGVSNLQYTDYGGSLGIFITGFNGVNAASNQYYDFQVNGTSSNVGVSSYIVQNGDVLKFVLTSF